MNKMNHRLDNKDNRQLVICLNEGEVLRDLNTYIPNMMNRLWELPEIVVSVIENTEMGDLKKHIAPFFVNNFYENILSSYYIEDNLMYVLTLLLQNEINGLNNIMHNEKFLDNTKCGVILEELRRKSDIQEYFKTIIKNAVEDLEANNSTFQIDLSPDNISNRKLKSQGSMVYKKGTSNENNSESESLETSIVRDKKKEQNDQENFNKNYIPNLDKKNFIELIEKTKTDKYLSDYLYPKLAACEKDEKIFSNEKLLNRFSSFKKPEELLVIYQNSFMIVINFLDKIINSIKNNFHLVPYSIKCICRIISETITKKFNSISEPDKNVFIAKFFFGKLLIPILKRPGEEAFVTNFISENTLKNLEVISEILNKYTSGLFYTTNESEFKYTPFNWYFVNNTKELSTIFQEFVKVRFPLFIENHINNNLPPDYEYDYFKENPDEEVNLRSIFFNIEQVKILVETIDKHWNKIIKGNEEKGNKIQKAVEKLMLPNNKVLIESILNSEHEMRRDSKKEKVKKKEKEKDKDKDKKKKDE